MRIGLIRVGRVGGLHARALRGLPGVDALVIAAPTGSHPELIKRGVRAGLDDRMPLRSAEPGSRFPAGPPHRDVTGRFGDAYVAEVRSVI
jgi:hypothetical protein